MTQGAFKLFGVLLISSWVLLSMLALVKDMPEEFQRLGSFGVAAVLIYVFVLLVRVQGSEREMYSSFEKIVGAELSLLSRHVGLSYEAISMVLQLTSIYRQIDAEDPQYSKRIEEIQERADAHSVRYEEISHDLNEIRDSIESSLKRLKILRNNTNLLQDEINATQLVMIVIATLQWGYGDRIVSLVHHAIAASLA